MALEDKLSGLDWVEILRSNVLGLAVCSLASRDTAMRALGRAVLAKTMELIEVRPDITVRDEQANEEPDYGLPRTSATPL